MNKKNLTQAILASLLISSSMVYAESDYPATNYEPRVLFHDGEANESAKKSQPVPKAYQPAASSTTESSASVPVFTKPAEQSDSNNLVILLALAAAAGGFFYFKSQSSGQGQGSKYRADPSGLTGVARYLKSIEGSAGTGVAKYLSKVEAQAKAKADAEAAAATAKAESTGVAKYIRENVPTSSADAGEATGVSKYLRNRG